MSKFDQLIDSFRKPLSNPRGTVTEFKKTTGGKVVGCLPPYCPEEIIHAAGMLPVGIWGGQTHLSKVNTYFPAFACSLVQTTLELGLRGVYDDLDAVIIPSACDTLKCVAQNWKAAIPQVPMIPLVHPQNRKLQAGIKYLQSEYENIRSQVERIGGKRITDADITDSIGVYNRHRRVMRDFVLLAATYPNVITPSIRHLIFKSAYFMEKSKHTELVQDFIREVRQQSSITWQGRRVILTGIMAEPESLLELFNEYRLAIVDDDLAHESRQYRVDVPDGNEPLERLATAWSNFEGCSLAFDPGKKRGAMLLDMVSTSQADGIVVCMMKFCDPEEFDYPIYYEQLQTANIPVLYLEIDQNLNSVEQLRTRIQGFAELLK